MPPAPHFLWPPYFMRPPQPPPMPKCSDHQASRGATLLSMDLGPTLLGDSGRPLHRRAMPAASPRLSRASHQASSQLLLSKTPAVSRWLSTRVTSCTCGTSRSAARDTVPCLSSTLSSCGSQDAPCPGLLLPRWSLLPTPDPKHGLCCLLFGTHSLGDVTLARGFQHSTQDKHSSWLSPPSALP